MAHLQGHAGRHGATSCNARRRIPHRSSRSSVAITSVHVSYGFADLRLQSASRSRETPVTEKFALAAGAHAARRHARRPAGAARPRSTYTIYAPAPGDPRRASIGERHSVRARPSASPEGVYYVVSTHGDANATVRADIKVEKRQADRRDPAPPGRDGDAQARRDAGRGSARRHELERVLAGRRASCKESVGAFATDDARRGPLQRRRAPRRQDLSRATSSSTPAATAMSKSWRRADNSLPAFGRSARHSIWR